MKVSDSSSGYIPAKRTLRFYMTSPGPCPYLEGMTERKVFTNLAIEDAEHIHDVLSNSGFRRSQNIAYKPACHHCSACTSARIPARDFALSKRWRRVLNKNKTLIRSAKRPTASREQYRLLKTYLESRHTDGGMNQMTLRDYVGMIEGSPVSTVIFEYREGEDEDAPLLAVAIADVMKDGLSMVYSFFDPELASRGIGNFIILDHIKHAQKLGLDYVYLGYWVKNSPKMGYKSAFRPLEVLDGKEWRVLQEDKDT